MPIAIVVCFTILLVVLIVCFFCADDGDVARDIIDYICESKKRERIKADAFIKAQEKNKLKEDVLWIIQQLQKN